MMGSSQRKEMRACESPSLVWSGELAARGRVESSPIPETMVPSRGRSRKQEVGRYLEVGCKETREKS